MVIAIQRTWKGVFRLMFNVLISIMPYEMRENILARGGSTRWKIIH